jgi:predicted aspartyl protease
MTQFKIALTRYLMLPVFSSLVFSSFMRAEGPATPSTLTAIHFRSPRGSSIVVPVYMNDNGPFDFLLDTGSTITFIDPELLRSLKLNIVEDGTVTALTGKTPIPLAIAQTVSVGPLTQSKVEIGARNLAGLREMDSKIRGVLGQNVLSNADYLIDYRNRTIEFDFAGSLAAVLDGERVNTIRIETPDNPHYWNTEVPVTLAESNPHTVNLILDTGSASVVLFSDSLDLARLSKRASLPTSIKDDTGNRTSVAEYPMQLHVGSISIDVEARVIAAGLKGLAVNGLLPTAGFGSVYISNSHGFVIFRPERKHNQPCDWSIASVKRKAASDHPCQHEEHQAGGNGSSPSL